MERISGYYYIIIENLGNIDTSNTWLIGAYDAEDKDWMLHGIIKIFKDSDFTEINETQILPPNN